MSPLTAIAGVGAGLLAIFGLSPASASVPDLGGTSGTSSGPIGSPAPDLTPPLGYPSGDGIDADTQLAAFLFVLRVGESNDNYGALVGGGNFTDFSHHPGWVDASMMKKSDWAGWRNSHAAGAYQFQPGTFRDCCVIGGLPGSFDQDNQDAAAIVNLKRVGAYDAVVQGNITAAWNRLQGNEWTSLGVRGLGGTVDLFEFNGGTVTS